MDRVCGAHVHDAELEKMTHRFEMRRGRSSWNMEWGAINTDESFLNGGIRFRHIESYRERTRKWATQAGGISTRTFEEYLRSFCDAEVGRSFP